MLLVLRVFRVRVVARTHKTVLMRVLLSGHRRVLLVDAVVGRMLLSLLVWMPILLMLQVVVLSSSRVLDKTWPSNHVLHALFLYLSEVAQMLQHTAQVFNLADVPDARLLEFKVLLVLHFLVQFRLGVVARVLLVIVLIRELILLCTFNDVESLLDFFKKHFGGEVLPLGTAVLVVVSNIEESTTSDLIKSISLVRIFSKNLLYQFLELVGVWYPLEYFPEVSLLRRRESLEVGVSMDSFSEGRRLHLHHKHCGTDREDVSFFSVVLWLQRKLAKLSIDLRVVEDLVLTLRFDELLLVLMEVDLIVPDLWSIKDLRAYVSSHLYHRIKPLLEQLIALDLGHAGGEAEVSDDDAALLVDQQVLRLDVPVHYAVRVQVLHAVHKLVQNVSCHVLAESLGVLDKAVELSVLRQLHHVVANLSFPLHDTVVLLLLLHEFVLLLQSQLVLGKLLRHRISPRGSHWPHTWIVLGIATKPLVCATYVIIPDC